MQLMLGDRVGPYVVERVVCRNDCDIVVACGAAGERVALKVLYPLEEPRDARQDQRFCRATAQWQRLDDPFLVKVLGVDSHPRDGTPLAIMEYLPSAATLRQQLDQGPGRLPESAALRIAYQLALALRTLDAAGLVHRDLSPENILLVRDNAKVIDVATADVTLASGLCSEADTVSGVGRWPGNVVYTAPELISGPRPLPDGRSDVYSLGCILFEMLAGQPPFPRPAGPGEEAATQSVAQRHLHQPPPALWRIDPLLSRAVVELVSELLVKDPAARPSAAALCERLGGIQSEGRITLRELLARAGRLGIYEVLQIGRKLAEGLAQHHRHLDPDCALVQPHRDAVGLLTVQVLPAQRQDAAYRAPECWTGQGGDGAEDIYALGAILFELLTGAPPFESSTTVGLTQLHREAAPPALRPRASSTCPPELFALVYRMLAKRPSRRPRLGEIKESLDALLAPLPPRMGPYTLVRRLGRGGAATVFQVYEDPAQPLALKLLHERASADTIARFRREFPELCALRDPGIVAYLDHGELADGSHYQLAEYLDGESLYERLCRVGTLSLVETVRLGHQLALSLTFLHARRILHRDIKPRNIMIVAAAGQEQAKLIDFGIAKLLDQPMTQPGAWMGTDQYAPEEQRRDAASVTAACDVFSLGVVLQEALTGVHPLASAAAGEPIFLDAARVPGVLARLLLDMQAPEPARRPAMSVVCEALAQLRQQLDHGAALPPRPPAARTYAGGDTVGEFTLLEKLQDRRTSAVFTARRGGEDRTLTVKIIYPHARLTRSAAQRLLERSAQLRRLDLPGTIATLGAERLDDGAIYAAMEYLPGLSLEAYLRHCGGQLAPDQAAALFASAAAALSAWQQAGLVYGALEPANLILGSEPADTARAVKLLPFQLPRPAFAAALSNLGGDDAHPRYSAPELCRSDATGEASPPSEVYALGVMLYEALSQDNPFHAETPAGVARRHLFEVPRPLGKHLSLELRSQVPELVELSALVERMLCKDPAERPTMAEVAQRLAGWVQARRIGDYSPLRVLGQGGMGQVLDVVHSQTGERRALKRLLRAHTMNADVARRFRNEERAVKKVDHPGVVQIHEALETPAGDLCLVMERLWGKTLKQDRTMPLWWLTAQLSAVLAAAHAKGVAHRDLKPDNIFLERAAEGPRVRLLDFGLAQLRGDDVSPLEQTKTGALMMGTPAYMAPEAWSGLKFTGPATDVYALGVILFELEAGTPPFTGTGYALGMQHISEPPPRLASRAYGVSPVLDDLVHRMLAKVKEDRPAMHEVHEVARSQLGAAPAPVGEGGAPADGSPWPPSLHEQETYVYPRGLGAKGQNGDHLGDTLKIELPADGESGVIQRVFGWFRRRVSD